MTFETNFQKKKELEISSKKFITLHSKFSRIGFLKVRTQKILECHETDRSEKK